MENVNSLSLEKSVGKSDSEDPVDPRALMIEDFLSDARKLDKDQNRVIDQRDIDWYSRLGEYTDERKKTYETLMKHRYAIEPECDGQDRVSLQSIDSLHGSVRGRLNRADESRKATEEATKHFDEIDLDKDGYLIDSEAHNAFRSGKISGETSQFLEKNNEQFQILNNDEWGFENNGISRKDLSIASQRDTSLDTIFIESLADELKGAPDLLFDLRTNWFDYLDLNDDEVVSRQELKYHTKDPGTLLSEEHQDVVKLLHEHDDLFKYTTKEEVDSAPLFNEWELRRLTQTVEGIFDDRSNQLNHYRHTDEYRGGVGNYAFGFGLPAGIVGAAIGAGACGLASGGNPMAADIGGVLGGGAGFFGGSAVGMHVGEGRMESYFNNGYEQIRQPALESFVDKYRFLRNNYLSKTAQKQ